MPSTEPRTVTAASATKEENRSDESALSFHFEQRNGRWQVDFRINCDDWQPLLSSDMDYVGERRAALLILREAYARTMGQSVYKLTGDDGKALYHNIRVDSDSAIGGRQPSLCRHLQCGRTKSQRKSSELSVQLSPCSLTILRTVNLIVKGVERKEEAVVKSPRDLWDLLRAYELWGCYTSDPALTPPEDKRSGDGDVRSQPNEWCNFAGELKEVSSTQLRKELLNEMLLKGWRHRLLALVAPSGTGKTVSAFQFVDATKHNWWAGFRWTVYRDDSTEQFYQSAFECISNYLNQHPVAKRIMRSQPSPGTTSASRLDALLELLLAFRCIVILDGLEYALEKHQVSKKAAFDENTADPPVRLFLERFARQESSQSLVLITSTEHPFGSTRDAPDSAHVIDIDTYPMTQAECDALFDRKKANLLEGLKQRHVFELLEYHPLAIRLLARHQWLSHKVLMDWLGQHFISTQLSRDARVDALIDYMIQLLPPASRRVLQVCTAFGPYARIDAVEAILADDDIVQNGQTADVIEQLATSCFFDIRRSGGHKYVSIHQLLWERTWVTGQEGQFETAYRYCERLIKREFYVQCLELFEQRLNHPRFWKQKAAQRKTITDALVGGESLDKYARRLKGLDDAQALLLAYHANACAFCGKFTIAADAIKQQIIIRKNMQYNYHAAKAIWFRALLLYYDGLANDCRESLEQALTELQGSQELTNPETTQSQHDGELRTVELINKMTPALRQNIEHVIAGTKPQESLASVARRELPGVGQYVDDGNDFGLLAIETDIIQLRPSTGCRPRTNRNPRRPK